MLSHYVSLGKRFFVKPLMCLALGASSFYVSSAAADNPVVGLIGASYIDPKADENNVAGLTALDGSAYRGLKDYLKATTILDPNGISWRSEAQGGGNSSGTLGFKSALQQAQTLTDFTTFWVGDTVMDAVVIDIFNNCLHSLAGFCPTAADIQNGLVADVTAAITHLQSKGVKVYVNKYPSYNSLDLPLVEQTFSQIIPNFTVATQAEYNLLKSEYESAMAAIPDVTLLNTWSFFQHYGDGLHPNHITKLVASGVVAAKIKSELNQ